MDSTSMLIVFLLQPIIKIMSEHRPVSSGFQAPAWKSTIRKAPAFREITSDIYRQAGAS